MDHTVELFKCRGIHSNKIPVDVLHMRIYLLHEVIKCSLPLAVKAPRSGPHTPHFFAAFICSTMAMMTADAKATRFLLELHV